MPTPEEQRFKGPLRGQLLFVLVFVVVSALLLSLIGDQTKWVKGTKFAAQPRFWPAVALIGMVLFGGLHLYYLPRRKFSRPDFVEWKIWFWAIEWVLWFLAYVLLVPLLGYLPTTTVFVPALLWRLGYTGPRWRWIGVGFAVAVVVVFKSFLQVKIPGGAIYEFLPGALRSFFILNF